MTLTTIILFIAGFPPLIVEARLTVEEDPRFARVFPSAWNEFQGPGKDKDDG